MELRTETQVATSETDDNDGGASAKTSTSMGPLGISVQALTPDAVQELELDPSVRGLLVTEVQPEGPAWDVLSDGSRGAPPDIILSVEGKPVKTEAELRNALKEAGPGSIVTLRLYTPVRGGGARRIERLRLSDTK
jgi:S1-C subfamily serine protease